MKSLRRPALFAINTVSTVLTVLTGFRDNGLIVLVTGRFQHIRSRLTQGRINYDVARTKQVVEGSLPALLDVASDYKFYRAPTRSPASTGEDRSSCLRVNSMNASVLAVYFDDVFGEGPRREQIFVYSISAPACQAINLRPAWVKDKCVGAFQGNETACFAHILSQFDALATDRSIQVGVPVDFGVVGVPFLKCLDRPAYRFQYVTDLMVLQSFWAGGSFQVEIQSSVCWADPAVVAHGSALFRAAAADQESTVVVAVPSLHWALGVISFVYSVVAIGFFIRGILLVVMARRSYVRYFRSSLVSSVLRFLPFEGLRSYVVTTPDRIDVLRFHGKSIIAANLWMNHWLYISLSIVDATINFRSVYMQLTMGTWMLSKRVTLENFLFVCTPLTKMTWISCLAHTVVQRALWIVLRAMSVAFTHPSAQRCVRFLRWYIDSVALFTSFKVYSLLLLLQLYALVKIRGTTTLTTRAANAKRPVYGGYAGLSGFWTSEVAIDLLVMCANQLLAAHVVGSFVLLTAYRRATHNRVLQILQKRYVFVGWDAVVVMDALGIDPYHTTIRAVDGEHVATTLCSGGALLRQLYASGPSGWFHFVGEDAFHSPASEASGKQEMVYPLIVAKRMGLWLDVCGTKISSNESTSVSKKEEQIFAPRSARLENLVQRSVRSVMPSAATTVVSSNTPFNERVLHVHVESTWGKMLLIDFQRDPARLIVAGEDRAEIQGGDNDIDRFVAVRDALQLMGDSDRKELLRGQLRLRLC